MKKGLMNILKFIFIVVIAIATVTFMNYGFNLILGILGLQTITWTESCVLLVFIRVFKWWLE